MEGEQEEFRRQLEFIIKQLNKTDEDRDGFDHDSDDEGDEDDDEVKSKKKIKSLFFSRYYAEACNEWWGPSTRLAPERRRSKETSQRWRAIDDTVRFERPRI